MTCFTINNGRLQEVEGRIRGRFFIGKGIKLYKEFVSQNPMDMIRLLNQRWQELQRDIKRGGR